MPTFWTSIWLTDRLFLGMLVTPLPHEIREYHGAGRPAAYWAGQLTHKSFLNENYLLPHHGLRNKRA